MSATAIAGSSAAMSAAAAARASQAQDMACKSFLASYDAKLATVTDMKEYASCVERIYPESASGGEIIAMKVAIVLVLAAAVVGFVKPLAGFDDGIFDRAMSSMMVAVVVLAFMLVLALVFLGIAFVVGA